MPAGMLTDTEVKTGNAVKYESSRHICILQIWLQPQFIAGHKYMPLYLLEKQYLYFQAYKKII